MTSIRAFGHVGIRCSDQDRAKAFCGVLGLKTNTRKPNWLGFEGSPSFLHLMPAGEGTGAATRTEDARDLANHVALVVDDLRVLVRHLLAAGFDLFQSELDVSRRRPVRSVEDDLGFGIGTVFTFGPDGNVVEFIQRDAGIYAAIADDGR